MRCFQSITRWVLGSLLVLFILLIIFLPTIASTSWGTQKVTQWFNHSHSGVLSIQKMKLSWFGNQTIEELLYHDKQGEKILSVERFDTETSLIYLLFGGRSLETTEIKNPYLVITQDEEKKEETFSIDHSLFASKVTVENGVLIFQAPKANPIKVFNIHVEKQLEPLIYHITAATEYGEIKGEIDTSISINDTTEIKGNINHFPLAILDQLDHSTFYTDTIGQEFDLNFDVIRKEDDTLSISGELESKNLSGHIEGEIKENTLYLDSTTHLQFTITPKLFSHFLPQNQKNTWLLASPADVSIEVEKGVVPLFLKRRNFKEMIFQAQGTLTRAEINHQTLGGYSLNNFTFDIIAFDNLEISYQGEIQGKESSALEGTISITPDGDILFNSNYIGFPVSLLHLVSPPIEKSVRELFGSVFDLKMEGTFKDHLFDIKLDISASDLNVKGIVKGDIHRLNFDIEGIKNVAGKRAKYFGSTIEFELEGLATFSKEGTSIPLITGRISTPYYSADITGVIGERGKKIDLHEAELIVKGEVTALPFGEEFQQAILKNGSFSLNIDGPSNKITGRGFINTQVGTINSKMLETAFEITDYIYEDALDFEQANYSFKGEFEDLPLVLLNPFIPKGIDLPTLLGPIATIEAQGRYTPTQEPYIFLDLTAQAEGFNTTFSVSIDGTLAINQNEPAYLHWILTPKRYETLVNTFLPDHPSMFELTKQASLDLTIYELTCPTNFPDTVSQFLCQSGFEGDLTVEPLDFKSKDTEEPFSIKNLTGSIKGTNFSEAIDLYFGGAILAQNVPDSEESAFKFEGNMLDFWTKEGGFNREGLTIDGELSFDLLPVKQASEIIPLDQETRILVQALLGELVNARIYGKISQLTGPLTIDIKSSNLKVTLPIMLHPHAIYLTDYVQTEVSLTEAINQTLIKDIAPLLLTEAYSEHPIKLFLDPQGFVIPIRPYSLQGVQVDKAMIDIGKINVRNGGEIQRLMKFLKAKGVSQEGSMQAWFTPIYMSLQNGTARYQRFDIMLGSNAHIALWGSVNLINKKVNMILGIASSTLYQHYKIKGLSPNDLFQVKMGGTINNVDLDWSSAYARIGIIITRTAGGQIGSIVGGLLEPVVKAFGEKPAPPPTTSPFPWEK